MCNRVTSKSGRGRVCPVCPWDHGRAVKNRCATGCMRDAWRDEMMYGPTYLAERRWEAPREGRRDMSVPNYRQ